MKRWWRYRHVPTHSPVNVIGIMFAFWLSPWMGDWGWYAQSGLVFLVGIVLMLRRTQPAPEGDDARAGS